MPVLESCDRTPPKNRKAGEIVRPTPVQQWWAAEPTAQVKPQQVPDSTEGLS